MKFKGVRYPVFRETCLFAMPYLVNFWKQFALRRQSWVKYIQVHGSQWASQIASFGGDSPEVRICRRRLNFNRTYWQLLCQIHCYFQPSHRCQKWGRASCQLSALPLSGLLVQAALVSHLSLIWKGSIRGRSSSSHAHPCSAVIFLWKVNSSPGLFDVFAVKTPIGAPYRRSRDAVPGSPGISGAGKISWKHPQL